MALCRLLNFTEIVSSAVKQWMIQIGAYVKDILNCKTLNKNKVLQLFSVTATWKFWWITLFHRHLFLGPFWGWRSQAALWSCAPGVPLPQITVWMVPSEALSSGTLLICTGSSPAGLSVCTLYRHGCTLQNLFLVNVVLVERLLVFLNFREPTCILNQCFWPKSKKLHLYY